MIVVLALLVAAAIAAPHVVRLERVAPSLGATVWLSALLLRALTAAFGAIAVVLVFPTTALFDAVTHWCWEAVIPVLTTQLGFDGHEVGDAALILPALVLAGSLVSVAFGLWRAARAVRRLVHGSGVGAGPGDSVILGDGQVLVAAAGLRRPRVVVSAGALTSFDDEELAASLEHERGHICRRHRYVLMTGELCSALGRCLPGTRRAARELAFHLERDADRYALARDHEAMALASAICKAAQSGTQGSPLAPALAGGNVTRRVRELLDGEDDGASRRSGGVARAIAALLVSLVVLLTAALPPATAAALDHDEKADVVRHC